MTSASVDPDGDEVTYRHRWFEDDVPALDLTEATVSSTRTHKGTTWRVQVTPFDGTDDGPFGEAEATIGNSAPEVEASITPAAPTTADVLTVSATISDADADRGTLGFVWSRNGTATSFDRGLILAEQTQRGELWSVSVTPNDGDTDGQPAVASVVIANAPPTVDGVRIEPARPTVADAIRAVVGAVADADGDVVTLSHVWSINGSVRMDLVDTELPAGTAVRGEVVAVSVEPHDGRVAGAPVSSAAVAVANTIPTIGAAEVTPASGTVTTVFGCQVRGWSDADGDPERVDVRWLVNGTSATVTPTLDGAWFSKRDDIACEATPVDGASRGTPVRSAAVRIANTPPSITSVQITPSAPKETDIVGVTVAGWSDPDADPARYRFLWSIDGVAGPTAPTLTGADFDKHQRLSVRVTPFDDDDDGPSLTAAEVTTRNSPPSIRAVTLTPTVADTTSTLILSPGGWSDADGDVEAYRFTWWVDGAEVQGVAAGTLVDTHFERGQVVTATVTPTDGEADGEGLRPPVLTIGNARPSQPIAGVADPLAAAGEALSCRRLTSSVDPDGDAVTYAFRWSLAGGAPVSGATVSASVTYAQEIWTCHVTPHDGIDAGPAGRAEVHVDGPSYTLIPAGTYLMGAPPGEQGRDSWETAHPVTLTRAFWIQLTEVTQAQWVARMGGNPSGFVGCGDRCPVDSVSWSAAITYVNALSDAEGLARCYVLDTGAWAFTDLDCPGYRLPTEAEWEYAGRAGMRTAFPGGDYSVMGCAAPDPLVDPVAWYCANTATTSPPVCSPGGAAMGCARVRDVATKLPNDWGLYDVQGNLQEWTNDAWHPDYVTGAPAIDPLGPAWTSTVDRMVRGGSWGSTARDCRIGSRVFIPGIWRSGGVGVRPVRTGP